jgi:hypothetical protein
MQVDASRVEVGVDHVLSGDVFLAVGEDGQEP